MARYTICHNDDDYRDPSHRRVVIEIAEIAGKYSILADGEPVELAPPSETEAEAEEAIHMLWCDAVWALRPSMTAQEFRARLKALGWTQRHLALMLGVTPRTVNRWATGALVVPTYCQRYLAPAFYAKTA